MAAYKDEERGTWYVSFHYYDWTGKNKRKLKRGFKTRKEALEWEQHFRMREESNLDMTFGDFWKSYEMDMKPKLKENTWNTKEAVVKSKILPYFKDKKMKDIRAKDIITWQNTISAMRGADGKPFKPTYLKTIQSELSALFNHAVRFYELKENPVIKAGPLGKGKADEMNFWTKEEYLKFIEAVKDKPVSYYAFQILYWCGLRLGELLALCASDIDTKNKVLHITKSYQRIAGKDVITDPKTPKSKRDVSIPDFLCGELEQYLGMLYGYMPTDRIFQISKSYLHHEMDRGAKAAGVKRIRIHDIRHSSVSLLINMGFTAVAIGNRVGHESADITYRYAHMFPSEQKEMAVMLNEAFVTEQPEKAGEKREGD
ncbi:site-specific integrase [bacterium 1xD8-6]|nr:site-specific integrase [bacterium D16-36]RKI68708.1 site-specific integrase [bacterium 1xD8-6]